MTAKMPAHSPGKTPLPAQDFGGHGNGQDIDGRTGIQKSRSGSDPAPRVYIPAKSGSTVQEQTASMAPDMYATE